MAPWAVGRGPPAPAESFWEGRGRFQGPLPPGVLAHPTILTAPASSRGACPPRYLGFPRLVQTCPPRASLARDAPEAATWRPSWLPCLESTQPPRGEDGSVPQKAQHHLPKPSRQGQFGRRGWKPAGCSSQARHLAACWPATRG